MQARNAADPYRILSLDGGGAKGFYTLGVLREIEGLVGTPLCEHFDLIFGTSTGAIIAALLALGRSVPEIHDLYRLHVPTVMAERSRRGRTAALQKLATAVFGPERFEDVKTGVGIVATRWMSERPMIFKHAVRQAHGRKGTFVPGFGVSIADAVRASCSAYPFFDRTTVKTSEGDLVELLDGGYCANNPTLYAIADAIAAVREGRSNLRVLNIGVGVYPEPRGLFRKLIRQHMPIQMWQKTLEINGQSMDQLRQVLFGDVHTVRISDTFIQPEMATDLLEADLGKLTLLHQRGRESFGPREAELRALLT